MELYHFTDINNKESIIKNGIKAFTRYDILSPIREDVVYCWLNKEDNKLINNNQICFKVNVDDGRCLIAEMDFISLAIMYKRGRQVADTIKKPINDRATGLLTELYEITAVKPCDYYSGVFFTPEVLVKGDIQASLVELCE